MNILVIYDSLYGNTEKVAKAIGEAITGDAKVQRVGEVDSSGLKTFDLLIIGSPTQGGRPTKLMQDFLNKLPESAIKGTKRRVFSLPSG